MENIENPAPEAPQFDEQPVANEGGNYNKTNVILYSVFAYILILWLIGLFAAPEKDSPIVKNHVNNGILLFIAWVADAILWCIPFIRWVVGPLVGLVILVFAIMGIVKACSAEKFELPIVGDKVTLIK